jgi:putative acetyltransferase
MLIRTETTDDISEIFALNKKTFESDAEAKLVDNLRQKSSPFISLVAENHGHVIGHIALSAVILDSHPELKIMAIAPMAVSRNHWRQGVGSALIRSGFEHCKELGVGAVVTLGSPDYYSRFGFASSAQFDIHCEYDVPAPYFMVIELELQYLNEIGGLIRYHDVFKLL